MDMNQPFAGIRVVEFGQFVSVPFCAQLLAEGGAEVIKVEALAGDPTRLLRQITPLETRTFLSRNRGKRSLPLALRNPYGAPGDRQVAGVGGRRVDELPPPASMWNSAWIPRRSSVGSRVSSPESVTAFGKCGPEASLAGMDTVLQARTGLMAANGRMVDGRPASGEPVSADYMCAMSLAFGVAAALLRRERTGRGGAVDVSLMQAAMTLANNQLVRSEVEDTPRHAEVLARLAEQRSAGVPFAEQAKAMTTARALPMVRIYLRTFDTADAPIAVACGSRSLRVKFMAVVGLEDSQMDSPDSEAQHEYYDRLTERVEAAMRMRTSADWTRALNAVGVPVAAVKFPVELFEDEHANANAMFHRLEHPEAGDFTVLSPPVAMDSNGFRPRERGGDQAVLRGATPWRIHPLGRLDRAAFLVVALYGRLLSRAHLRDGDYAAAVDGPRAVALPAGPSAVGDDRGRPAASAHKALFAQSNNVGWLCGAGDPQYDQLL